MNINFLKFSKFFSISSLIIVIAFLAMIFIKGFTYGTDFTGGIELNISFSQPTSATEIENKLKSSGLKPEIEKIISKENSYRIRHLLLENDATITENKFTEILDDHYSGEYKLNQIHIVGGVLSSQNKSNALTICLIVVLLIIGYITFRFNLSYSIAAVVAVLHDIVIMLGFVLLMEIEMQVLVIVASLTIFGYSVNDSIILFDRIREKKRNLPATIENYRDLLNLSINSVFSRTIITSFTTLIVVTALYVSTEGSYKEFASVLIVGILSGTYSSIYIAGTTLLIWDKKKPQLES